MSPIAFILEAVVSIGIAALLDIFVMRRLLSYDFDFIDDSSIAFQTEMAVFAFLVQIITSLFTRRQYKLSCRYAHTHPSKNIKVSRKTSNYRRHGYSSIDANEKKSFEYERRFGSVLPKRFSSDPLLRCVFFSVMAIEDSNRPESFRFFERIACTVGLAHSTGIMQQKSNKPLSDHESVKLAAAYISRMWDTFLTTFAKSIQSGYSPDAIVFTSWYRQESCALFRQPHKPAVRCGYPSSRVTSR